MRSRKSTKLRLIHQNEDLKKLNQFALELSNLSSNDNLEEFITNQIKEFACAKAAVFNEYDSITKTTTTKQIIMESGLLEKVVSIVGKNIQDIHSSVSDEQYRVITSEMVGVRETLYDASFGAIPRSVGAAIQSMLKVDRIIGVAYVIEGKLYGTTILLMGKGQPDPPKEILENFVHLAASSLRRNQVGQNLRENEEKLKFYTDNSPMAVIEWDSDFKISRWAGDSEKIFGWNFDEVHGKKMKDLHIIYETDIKEVDRTLEKLIHGEIKQIVTRNRNYRKDGSIIICDWYHTILKNQNGKMLSVLSQAIDITEKMKYDDALRESEKLYRSLFDNMLNGFAYCQMHYDENDKPCDFTYISVNRAFEVQTGLLNVVGKKVTEVIPDIRELDNGLIEIYGRVSKTGMPKNFEMYINSLQSWYSVSTYSPNPGYFVSVFENITNRKNTENDLKESHQFNKHIINSVQEGIIVYDRNLHYQEWNAFMEKLTGIPASEVLGKQPEEIFPFLEESGVIESLHNALSGKNPEVIDFPYNIPVSGKSGWVSDKNMPFRDTNGEVIGVIRTIYDITERKKFEQELIRAKEKAEESERLKSAFLANMSHEIRTPMNGILGFAELLKEPGLTPREQQDFINTIGISGARMLNTINNIVDVSKIESGLMKVDIHETDINEKVEFIYKFFKPETDIKGLQLIFKNGLPYDESNVRTDNEKVYAVLTNLVKNAIKFTEKGSIEFGYEKTGGYLKFFVKDTGVGIPQNYKELIFERFRQGSEAFSRNYEGSGLGLTISKSYVEMLGGNIWVESEIGKGSTFYFTIPYNPVTEEINIKETITPGDTKKSDHTINLKILIAEDDEISYSLLVRNIQMLSSKVLHAITGIEAVEACRNNPDLDLVLMDIRMPRMNGLEATRLIRQFNKNVVIIAQTAYGFSSDCEKALAAGCNDYISKPINRTALHSLIDRHCRKVEI